jgi:23S rRNA pseudouridine1911/1915/1917 synthase
MDPPAPPPSRSDAAGLRCFAVAEPGRLDVCLAAQLEVSRAEVRRLLAGGGVSLDGRLVSERDKGARLEAGAQLAVAAFTPPARRRPRPEPAADLAILAEGPGWLAVDKPAGRPVHPFAEDESGTLLNAVLARRPEIFGVGEGGLRSGVVHRLDVDTSGVLLFATEARAWRRLRRAFATAAVHKRYRAIVLGELAGEGSLELDLVVARHRPARVRVARPGEQRQARRVQLSWCVIEKLAGASLVEVQPRTGFLHQIRACLAHLGHPVAGDRTYAAQDPTGAPRQMLHATEVRWKTIQAASPDPADFAALRSQLVPRS